jgi:hypothetical protein
MSESNPMRPFVESDLHASMNRVADIMADVFEGRGFALLVFPLNDDQGGFMNYISNAKRDDMLTAMREFIAATESRTFKPPKGVQ